MSGSNRVDVVVVGAGFAGLTAARALQASGRTVRVLEARDRSGGRVYTIERGGCRLEMGASFTGPGQEPLKKLASELGVAWTQRPSGGRDLYYASKPGGEAASAILDAPPYDAPALIKAVRALESMAADVPADRPWEAPAAAELDRQTFAGWVESNVPEGARVPLYLTAEGFAGARNEVSLLHLLFYSKANGGFSALLGIADVPHDNEVFPGGVGEIAERIVEELGGAVEFSAPVASIAQDAETVTVKATTGEYTARHVIVAMPPGVAGRIRFDPELPAARRRLAMRYQTQSETKFHLVYERPFWRDQGLSGSVFGDDGFFAFDSTVEDGPGVLTGFWGFGALVGGEPQAEPSRQTQMTERLTRFFGGEARKTIAYADENWLTQTWSLGCVHYAPPGMWTSCGAALREPFGRVIWAGAETATSMTGQMDGAVRSGLRAADEVADLLGAGSERRSA